MEVTTASAQGGRNSTGAAGGSPGTLLALGRLRADGRSEPDAGVSSTQGSVCWVTSPLHCPPQGRATESRLLHALGLSCAVYKMGR